MSAASVTQAPPRRRLRDRIPVVHQLRQSVGLQRGMLVAGLVMLGVFILCAIFAPLLAPYGFAQRREDGDEQEDHAQHDTDDEHAALEADALADLVHDRQPVPQPTGRRGLGDGAADMSVPDPRVDERGDDVDDEVRERHDHGEQHDDALHGDEVAGIEVLDELEAEALPLEGLLGQHRADSSSAICRPITVMIGMSAGR